MLHWSWILLIAIAIIILVLYWLRRTYAYWWRRRIKYIQPTPLLGNLKELFNLNASFAVQLSNIYFDPRFEHETAVGLFFFHKPCLLIRDLELARTVLIKDFSSFSNRYASCDPHNDKMGALNLLFVKNPAWREIRTKLAPVFTNSNIRQMFPLMEEIGAELESQLAALPYNVSAHSVIVDVTEICTNFCTDVVASIAFGLRGANKWQDSHAEFRANGRKMFAFSLRRAFDFFIMFFVPQLVQVCRATLLAKEHSEFLRRTVHKVLEERERTGYVRHDLIDILLTLKKEAELNADETHFAHCGDYLVAQAAAFKIAGCETSASTMAFALYELAKHTAVQARLRHEVLGIFEKCATISYESITNEMPYLDMVIDETLRLYPVVPFLDRECTPLNSRRRYSLKPFAEFNIPKGMPIFISNFAIHRDPKYWPEPLQFEPERFSAANKKSHVPMSYMPFGLGPHNCIGARNGILQAKLGLVHLLRSHRVEVCTQTIAAIDFDPRYVLLTNKGDIRLKIIKCD